MNKYFPLKKTKTSKKTYDFFNNILELISISTNAVCSAFDLKGEQISTIFNHNKFCQKLSKVLPEDVFKQLCVNQHKEAFLESVKEKKPICFHCSFGFLSYIFPVTLHDKDTFIFVGQILAEREKSDFLEDICRKFPAAKKVIKEYRTLPKIQAGKLKSVVKSFSKLLDNEIRRYNEINEKSEKLLSFRKEMQDYFVEIGTAMGSALNLHNLLNLIVQSSTRLVNADCGSICLIENKDLLTRVTYGDRFDKGVIKAPHALNIQESLIGWSRENMPLDYLGHGHGGLQEAGGAGDIKSYLGIPLLIKDEVKGILNIYDDKPREFSLEEIEMLTAFANQAALAIDNIQLFQYEQTRAREATDLYNAVKIIGQSLNLDDVVNLSIQQMIKIAEVNRCIMYLYDDEASVFNFAGSAGLSEEQVEVFSMLKPSMSDFKENIWDQIRQGQCVFFDKMPQMGTVLHKIYEILPSNFCLIVPLFTKEGLTGLFYIDDSNIAKTFPQPELKVIMTLSVQIAMAIQRAKLLNKVEENFNYLRALYNLSTSLGILKLDKICELIVKKTSELMDIKNVSLIMLNEERDIFEVASESGIHTELKDEKAVEKIIKLVIGRRKPVVFSIHQKKHAGLKTILKKAGMETILCLPMYSKNRLIGVLSLFGESTTHFSAQSIRLIQGFITQAIVSIENALLYKIVQNKVHELATIFEVGKSITSTLHFDKVLREISETTMKAVHSDAVSIMLLDEKLQELSIKTAKGLSFHHYKDKIKVGRGVAGIAVKTGHPMMLIDTDKPRTALSFPDSVRKDNLKTILSVPLKSKGRIIGLLNLYASDIYYYSQAEINLVSTLTNQAAMALENAMLYQDQYDIAQIIQSSLMPQKNVSFEGVDIGSKYIPSLQLSGDYYDLVPLSGNKFAVYISDVAGKGTEAAIYTVRGKYILRSFSSIEYEPGDVLFNLNQILYPETEEEKFISVFYAIVDLNEKTIKYSGAGHEPAILYKANGDKVETLNSAGLLIGVNNNETYGQETVSIEQGDILILYTDGITEARSKEGELFGFERLKNIISESKDLSSQKIADKIYNEIQKFTLKNLSDDFTLLVIKF
ncbi:MAG: SpoIIE family protein phosphatase [Armatimonadota bacterium]